MSGVTLVGANLVQEMVPAPHIGAIAFGAASCIAWELLFGITNAHLHVGANVLRLALPIVGAAFGAQMAIQRKHHSRS